jgi:hypothetical protein
MSGSNVLDTAFLSEFIDDWICMGVKCQNVRDDVPICNLIAEASSAIAALIVHKTEEKLRSLLGTRMDERCIAICRLIKFCMHAPAVLRCLQAVMHLHSYFPSMYTFLLRLVDRKTATKLRSALDSSSVTDTLKLMRNRVKCRFIFEVDDVEVDGSGLIPQSSHICCTYLGIWLPKGFHRMEDVQSIIQDASCCELQLKNHTLRIDFSCDSDAQLFHEDFLSKKQVFTTLTSWQLRSAMDFEDMRAKKKKVKRPRPANPPGIIIIIITIIITIIIIIIAIIVIITNTTIRSRQHLCKRHARQQACDTYLVHAIAAANRAGYSFVAAR